MSRKYLIFPEKFPRFPDSQQNLPDSRNKFVFLPKQPLLELSPPVIELNLRTNLHSSLRKSKSLLYHWCQFTDASTFLSKNILGPGRQYDDLSSDGSNTNFDSTVTIFC